MTGEKVYFSDEVQVKVYYRSLLVMQEFKLDEDDVSFGSIKLCSSLGNYFPVDFSCVLRDAWAEANDSSQEDICSQIFTRDWSEL